MTTILIVDDSAVDRRLIGGIVHTNTSYRVEFASDGNEALEHIELSRPDLVITDLVMPGMDGLELIRQLRERTPQIPAILMTAYGNEDTAAEALEACAASYVPKAQQAERLIETVDSVLARAQADRFPRQANCQLDSLACTYTLGNDPKLIGPVVDQLQQTMSGMNLGDSTDRIRTGVAVEEALRNAMYHGNLEIYGQQLAESRRDYKGRALAELIKSRRQFPTLGDRRVYLDVDITANFARFRIRDEGKGFRHETVPNRLADYFEHGKNRGSMLMRSIMDEVSYNAPGNEVTLTKRPSCDRRNLVRIFATNNRSPSSLAAVG